MNHLSAGRVQIAALILCINQRNSIIAKEIKKYWNIEGVFKINKKKFSITAKLLNRNEYFISYDIQEVRDIINSINIETIWNTSFNIKGEPIVDNIENAISTFYRSGLDVLILGNYLIKK